MCMKEMQYVSEEGVGSERHCVQMIDLFFFFFFFFATYSAPRGATEMYVLRVQPKR